MSDHAQPDPPSSGTPSSGTPSFGGSSFGGSSFGGLADRVLRLATRGSAQARTQSEAVAEALCRATPGITVELVVIATTGDVRVDVPLHTIGGQGVFVREVQQAVLDGRADLAVHSAKDLPAAATPGLVLGAIGARRDARDALVGRTLAELAPGATVATGSVRRRALLAARRPDLSFVELRGNIATRLSRIPADGAIVMAVAALEILGWTDRIAEILDPEWMVPMVGQGAVAVECRADDGATRAALVAIDHGLTRQAVEVERAWLRGVGAGCSAPVGAHVANGRLSTVIYGPSGTVRRVRPLHDLVAMAPPSAIADSGTATGPSVAVDLAAVERTGRADAIAAGWAEGGTAGA